MSDNGRMKACQSAGGGFIGSALWGYQLDRGAVHQQRQGRQLSLSQTNNDSRAAALAILHPRLSAFIRGVVRCSVVGEHLEVFLYAREIHLVHIVEYTGSVGVDVEHRNELSGR